MDKNIAIIPARGGSKRLKNKNIYPFLGKPLIGYSIQACLNSKYISKVYVSSEDDTILDIGKKFGAYPLKRNPKFADDQTPKIIAIQEAIKQLDDLGIDFENVAVVQANSPQLDTSMLDKGFELFFENNLWEVMSANNNGVQNAAFRIIKKSVAFQPFLSAHCGFSTCEVIDVHTLEDLMKIEKLMR